jgi:hypothetical protein
MTNPCPTRKPLGWLPCLGALFLGGAIPAPADTNVGASIVEGVPAAHFMAAGDLNSDGKSDVALVEVTAPKDQPPVYRLHLLYQKAGGFSMPPDKTVDLPGAPSGLALGDFDRDGKNDLAVGLRRMKSLSLYLGGEGFEKEHRSAYGNDSGAACLSWGRMSRDGLADFVTSAAWRKWMGNNTFQSSYFCGPERNDNWRSTLADMDGNGTDDVVFTTWGTGNPKGSHNLIRIYYGPFLEMGLIRAQAAAAVVTLTSPFTDTDKQALGQPQVGDLNGDDQPDIVVESPDGTLVYLQNSPTGFTEGAGPSFALDGVKPLLLNDLDGDGLCDLVLNRINEKGIIVWRQSADRPLSGAWRAAGRAIDLPGAAVEAAAADLAGGGIKTLFIGLEKGGIALVKE